MKSAVLMIAGVEAMVMAGPSRERHTSEVRNSHPVITQACAPYGGLELRDCHARGLMYCSNPGMSENDVQECMQRRGYGRAQRRDTGTVDDWASFMQDTCDGRVDEKQCMVQFLNCLKKDSSHDAIRTCVGSERKKRSEPAEYPSLQPRDHVCNHYDDVDLCEYVVGACQMKQQRNGHSVEGDDDAELQKCISQALSKAGLTFRAEVDGLVPLSTGPAYPAATP